jgi:phospholipase/carboxylesterase
MLLLHPGLLRAAVLLKPQIPFEPEESPDLDGTPVFIAAGRADVLVAPEETNKLVDLLARAGADVTVRWSPGGHELRRDEGEAAKEWLRTRAIVRNAGHERSDRMTKGG